jgi:hypothetical protein
MAADYLCKASFTPCNKLSFKGAEGVSQLPSPSKLHYFNKTEKATARKKQQLFYCFALVD